MSSAEIESLKAQIEGLKTQLKGKESQNEALQAQADTLLNTDEGYKAFDSEIAKLKGEVNGLEKLCELFSHADEFSIQRYNAGKLWLSYKSTVLSEEEQECLLVKNPLKN